MDGGRVGLFARRADTESTYVIINNGSREKTIRFPVFESASEVAGATSRLTGKDYVPLALTGGEALYNADINRCQSLFEMALPACHFDIVVVQKRM